MLFEHESNDLAWLLLFEHESNDFAWLVLCQYESNNVAWLLLLDYESNNEAWLLMFENEYNNFAWLVLCDYESNNVALLVLFNHESWNGRRTKHVWYSTGTTRYFTHNLSTRYLMCDDENVVSAIVKCHLMWVCHQEVIHRNMVLNGLFRLNRRSWSSLPLRLCIY